MKSLFRSKRSGADQAKGRKGPGIYRHKDELWHLLLSCKSYFVTVMVFSCAINLLYLAGPLYMLQVYDRVVSSGSIVTRGDVDARVVACFRGPCRSRHRFGGEYSRAHPFVSTSRWRAA